MPTIVFLQLCYFPTRNLKIFKLDCAHNLKETDDAFRLTGCGNETRTIRLV